MEAPLTNLLSVVAAAGDVAALHRGGHRDRHRARGDLVGQRGGRDRGRLVSVVVLPALSLTLLMR
ncbi:MAG: hypothetical protein WKF94_01380 [Solirubrobacteraceae bacterium]